MKATILRIATSALVLILAVGVAFAHDVPAPKMEKHVGDYTVKLTTNPEKAFIGTTTLFVLIKDDSGKVVKDAKVSAVYKKIPAGGPDSFAKASTMKLVLKGDTYQGDMTISREGVQHITVSIERAGKTVKLDEDIYVFPVNQY